MPLDLAERESVFVVFRNAVPAPERSASAPVETKLTTLSGPWTLDLSAELGCTGERADAEADVVDGQHD